MGKSLILGLLLAGQVLACETYFHVAFDGPDGPVYGATSKNMREWWSNKGKKAHPTLCYTDEPELAAYVVVWGLSQTSRQVNLPAYSSTQTSGTIGNRPVSIQSQTQGSRPATQVLTTVYAAVYNEQREAVWQGARTGKFRWSKPDENALEDALKGMADGFKDSAPGNRTGLE